MAHGHANPAAVKNAIYDVITRHFNGELRLGCRRRRAGRGGRCCQGLIDRSRAYREAGRLRSPHPAVHTEAG